MNSGISSGRITGDTYPDNELFTEESGFELGVTAGATSLIVETLNAEPPDPPIASADITTLTNQNVTVTAIFSSGSVKKQYSFNDWSWMTYTTGVEMTENGTVYFRSLNSFGIASDVTSYTVSNIDKEPPVKPTVKADITTRTAGPVTVTATFSKDSAVREYSLDDEIWQTYTSGVEFLENGKVWFRGTDAAGNLSEVASYTVSNISADAPVPIVTDLSTSGFIDPGTGTIFKPNLAESGLYTLGGTFVGSKKGSVTIWDENGKKVASGTVKGGVVNIKKELLLDKGNAYKVEIKNTDTQGSASMYSVELRVKELFTDGDNTDDTVAGAKTLAAGGSVNDWVGYGDAADYYKLGVAASGGFYDLGISGVRNSVKLTVYSEQGKKLKSVTASAKKPSVPLADLCLGSGSYAVVEAPKAAKAQNSEYVLKFTERATFNRQNNDWNHAEVITSDATFTGVLTKAAGGDTVDYCDVSALGNLTIDMTAGKAKVSFYDANRQAVKVALDLANGKSKFAASLTLASGNVATNRVTIIAVNEFVKYLKIEAAGKKLNSYTVGMIA